MTTSTNFGELQSMLAKQIFERIWQNISFSDEILHDQTQILEKEKHLDNLIQFIQNELENAKTKEDELLFFKYLMFLNEQKERLFILQNPQFEENLPIIAYRMGKKMQSGCELKN